MVEIEQDLKWRTKHLGVDVIRLVECLPPRQTTGILGKQLIRCATSVGANYRAACRARSKADFIGKLAIAEEESDETMYWLELLQELKLPENERIEKLHREAEEITKILAASGKTAKTEPDYKVASSFSIIAIAVQTPKSKIQNALLALSSNGLGRGPLKAEIRVRSPLRLHGILYPFSCRGTREGVFVSGVSVWLVRCPQSRGSCRMKQAVVVVNLLRSWRFCIFEVLMRL